MSLMCGAVHRRMGKIYKKYKEIINYIIAGGMTTAVSMALFYGSVWTVLDGTKAVQLQTANVFSWCGSVVFAYIVNRIFVFGSCEPKIYKEFLYFAASRVFTLLLDMFLMYLGTAVIGVEFHIMKLISMAFVTAGNYVVSKFGVFRS